MFHSSMPLSKASVLIERVVVMQDCLSCGYLLLDLQQGPPGSFRVGDALKLGVQHGKAVLTGHSGRCYIWCWSSSRCICLAESIVNAELCHCVGF